jgi:hypothetical protein
MIPTCPPETYPAGTVSVCMPHLFPAAKSSNTEDGNGGQDTFRAVKYSAVLGKAFLVTGKPLKGRNCHRCTYNTAPALEQVLTLYTGNIQISGNPFAAPHSITRESAC